MKYKNRGVTDKQTNVMNLLNEEDCHVFHCRIFC